MDAAGASPSGTVVSRAPVLLPALVILLGAVLRLSTLGLDVRLHPDEALFAAQARLISAEGDWLLRTTDLDKPPLTLYVTALSFNRLGISEFAARLPNVFASILTLALVYRLSKALFCDRSAATLSTLLIALSPFDLAFAATTFTDVQATLWVLVACALAARDRWALAGLASALMIAAKTTALLAMPLVVALGMARCARTEWRGPHALRRLWRFAVPLATGIALLLLWDLARAPRSFWALGWAHNDPGRPIRSDELLPRLDRWLGLLRWSTGSTAITASLAVLLVLWLARLLIHRSRAATIGWVMAGWSVASLGWYWLVAFNTYDRYLHPLIPVLFLMAGWASVGVLRAHRLRSSAQGVLISALILLMLPGTAAALRGDIPIGGDRGQHTGIDQLAGYLNEEQPGAVVYDHWLGWELAYYLGTDPAVKVVYMPLPEQLVADVTGHPDPRFFVAPAPERAALWIALLQRAGVATTVIYSDPDHDFVVYHLQGPRTICQDAACGDLPPIPGPSPTEWEREKSRF